MQAIHTVRYSRRTRDRNDSQPQPPDARRKLAAGRSSLLVLPFLGLLLTLIAMVGASAARAGAINVWACHESDGQTAAPMDRWTSNINAAFIDASNTCDSAGAGVFGIMASANFHPGHSYGTWQFSAPPSTTVTGFTYNRTWSVSGWASVEGFRGISPVYDSPHLFELCQAAAGCHDMAWGSVGTGVSSEAGVLLMLESCAQAGGCDASSNGWVMIHSARVTLDDSQAPTVSGMGGALTSGSQLRGNASLSFQAGDAGTGLYQLHATVDGVSFDDRTLDTNGGKCQTVSGPRDFVYAVPCPLNLGVSTVLHTGTLVDGSHAVDVKLEDAAGNLTTVFHDDVTTHNAPASTERPEITGTAAIGQQLSAGNGLWSPTPTSFTYRWMRCPPSATLPSDVDACTTIAGATSASYQPVLPDVYGRLMVRVTGSNASGADSAVSAPSAIVADSQGRTSAPTPDPTSPRDVLVVPVSPSGGGGSSTTIVNNSSTTTNGGARAPIEGLVNPLAVRPGHVANGTNAQEGAGVHIAFEIRPGGRRKQVAVVRSTRNRRWVVKGTLRNAQGAPIGGGQLVTAWQVNGKWTAHTGVRTRSDGAFAYVLPKGPSRAIKFVYFAYSDSNGYAQSNTVSEKVTTPVTLSTETHAATNLQRVSFSGTVGSDSIPKAGVLITLEASYPGSGWQEFKVIRAHRGGRFSAAYRFHKTSIRTLYRFRARVEKQAAYPFEGGVSRSTAILVTP